MTNDQQTRWEVIFAAPIVLALILTGVWLVMSAAYENFHLSRAADQIIRTVSLAREMRIPKNASTQRVTEAFTKRMAALNIAPVIITKSAFLDKPAQRGYENPWGNSVSVYFYPQAQAVRLEGAVSAAACRRLLLLYAEDPNGLGMRRIDIKNEDIAGAWRLVYEASETNKGKQIVPAAIHTGCGKKGTVLLSLSFSL